MSGRRYEYKTARVSDRFTVIWWHKTNRYAVYPGNRSHSELLAAVKAAEDRHRRALRQVRAFRKWTEQQTVRREKFPAELLFKLASRAYNRFRRQQKVLPPAQVLENHRHGHHTTDVDPRYVADHFFDWGDDGGEAVLASLDDPFWDPFDDDSLVQEVTWVGPDGEPEKVG